VVAFALSTTANEPFSSDAFQVPRIGPVAADLWQVLHSDGSHCRIVLYCLHAVTLGCADMQDLLLVALELESFLVVVLDDSDDVLLCAALGLHLLKSEDIGNFDVPVCAQSQSQFLRLVPENANQNSRDGRLTASLSSALAARLVVASVVPRLLPVSTVASVIVVVAVGVAIVAVVVVAAAVFPRGASSPLAVLVFTVPGASTTTAAAMMAVATLVPGAAVAAMTSVPLAAAAVVPATVVGVVLRG